MAVLLLVLAVISVSVVVLVQTTRTEAELATLARRRGRVTGLPANRGVVVGRSAPLWRRIIAVPVLVVIWIGIGLVIAALAGATLAGLALLFQNVLS